MSLEKFRYVGGSIPNALMATTEYPPKIFRDTQCQ
ncbi:hypothetical protein OROGR_020460 [Orobanche gracilis]